MAYKFYDPNVSSIPKTPVVNVTKNWFSFNKEAHEVVKGAAFVSIGFDANRKTICFKPVEENDPYAIKVGTFKTMLRINAARFIKDLNLHGRYAIVWEEKDEAGVIFLRKQL